MTGAAAPPRPPEMPPPTATYKRDLQPARIADRSPGSFKLTSPSRRSQSRGPIVSKPN